METNANQSVTRPAHDLDSRYFWHTLPQDQGQIVTYSQPQRLGKPEGDEGRDGVAGLRLSSDASDRTWSLSLRGKTIANGSWPAPTVAEARVLRQGGR